MSHKLVHIGDPVLRQVARELSREEILSAEIQALIHQMKEIMYSAPGVGLAAPQIGKSLQIVTIEDKEEYYISLLSSDQIKERERKPVPFHVIINPKIIHKGEDTKEFYERCLSVPYIFGIVPRALEITIEYLNEKAEPTTIQARGWYARILQHEIDHLQGTLCLDRTKLHTCTTLENYETFWKH